METPLSQSSPSGAVNEKQSLVKRSWNLSDKTKHNTSAPTREIEIEKQNTAQKPYFVLVRRCKQLF